MKIKELIKLADRAVHEDFPGSPKLAEMENLGPSPRMEGRVAAGIESRYYAFLWFVAREMKPVQAVDLGTYNAVSACVMKEAGKGKVLTVDIHPPEIAYDRCLALGIELVAGHSHAVGKLGPVDPTPWIDLLFIDTEHDGNTARGELEIWGPQVKKGGVICFDDIDLEPMKQFWSEVPEPKVSDCRLHPASGFGYMVKE